MNHMGCGTMCGCADNEGRNFLTTEEKIKKLQEYKEYLDQESKGVDEVIAKMKKSK